MREPRTTPTVLSECSMSSPRCVVELDEHVIFRVLERVLDVCPDGGYCGREGE